MSKRMMGTYEIDGLVLIYDGVVDSRKRSTPIAICPKCGGWRRIHSTNASKLRRGVSKVGYHCKKCALENRKSRKSQPRLIEDKVYPNGVTIHWSKRSGHSAPVTYVCGCKNVLKHAPQAKYSSGLCAPCSRQVDRRAKSRVDSSGYTVLWVDALDESEQKIARPMMNKNKYVSEHRLMMAMHIGRPLVSDEVVHHLNGLPGDNRIENLRIVARHTHPGENRRTMAGLHTEISRLQNILDENGIAY